MTYTLPRRFTTWQFGQIFFTLARTFISLLTFDKADSQMSGLNTLPNRVNGHPALNLPIIETDRCYHFRGFHSNYNSNVVDPTVTYGTGHHCRAVTRWNDLLGGGWLRSDVPRRMREFASLTQSKIGLDPITNRELE